jgi:hypothetical protein
MGPMTRLKAALALTAAGGCLVVAGTAVIGGSGPRCWSPAPGCSRSACSGSVSSDEPAALAAALGLADALARRGDRDDELPGQRLRPARAQPDARRQGRGHPGQLRRLLRGRLQAQRRRLRLHAGRLLLFSEARFQFRSSSRAARASCSAPRSSQPLETPWPNATTGDLLTRAIQDVDLAGNFYASGAATRSSGCAPTG